MPDIVRQSHLFGSPLRTPPARAETVSFKLLAQGGFVRQLAAGIFSLLPLGFRVHERIIGIIRAEMVALGAQEILLPALQPKALWEETGRWKTIDPPLFTVLDRHARAYALAPTHEEAITDLARTVLSSYKQLPVSVFQIQTKFRNEQRATGGLLRTREFAMKDLYSFHATEKDLAAFYEQVKQAYVNVFRRCGLSAVPVAAESGSIGGTSSHEFVVLAEAGEDLVALCPSCGFGAKTETLKKKEKRCPLCAHQLVVKHCIEGGHMFQLGRHYSEKMRAQFTAETGSAHAFVMGCYGIGVGRLLAAIVEAAHDDNGIIWPASVAPFDAHVLDLAGGRADVETATSAERVADAVAETGRRVLWDDRDNASAGEKFAEADLLGIPWRIVASERQAKAGTVGLKRRAETRERSVKIEDLASVL